MPETPATCILLAGSLTSFLSVLILFNEAEACSEDLDQCLHRALPPLSVNVKMNQIGQKETEVIRR